MTLALFRDDPYARSCEATVTAKRETGFVVDRTVFYPTGGGQPGDIGTAQWAGGTVAITGSGKGEKADEIVHLCEGPAPDIGEAVTLTLDWSRRHRLMRMHTTMHLICSLVDGDVTGGQVGDAKSRLDFNLPAGAIDKAALDAALNALIAADHPVQVRWISDAELADNPGLVRTMSVKPPTGSGRVRLVRIGGDEDAPVDLQPCGGTHVARTGEIGPIRIGKIENKGKQNRRVNVTLEDP